MKPADILIAILQFGPQVLPLIQQVTGWVKEGKKEVTPEDIAQLIEYGRKSSADYLREIGVVRPSGEPQVPPT